jgi:phage FluMu protein Com
MTIKTFEYHCTLVMDTVEYVIAYLSANCPSCKRTSGKRNSFYSASEAMWDEEIETVISTLKAIQ